MPWGLIFRTKTSDKSILLFEVFCFYFLPQILRRVVSKMHGLLKSKTRLSNQQQFTTFNEKKEDHNPEMEEFITE